MSSKVKFGLCILEFSIDGIPKD